MYTQSLKRLESVFFKGVMNFLFFYDFLLLSEVNLLRSLFYIKKNNIMINK